MNIKDMVNPEDHLAWTDLPADTQERLRTEAMHIKAYLQRARTAEKDAQDYLTSLSLPNEELGGLWCLFESYERSALKRRLQ